MPTQPTGPSAAWASCWGGYSRGVLIALFGAANVLLVDAATFAVSAISIAVGVPSAARGGTAPVQGKRGYLPELLKGLRFVRTNTLILSMILVATVTNFLDIPLVSVVLPVYAKTFYGSPTSLGTMVGALAGGGALAGTLVFAALGHRLPHRLTFVVCFVTAPLVIYGVLAATPPLNALAWPASPSARRWWALSSKGWGWSQPSSAWAPFTWR